MDYQEKIRVLNGIERSVPIDQLEYRGLKVWPLVRLELWKRLHAPQQEPAEPSRRSLKDLLARCIPTRKNNYRKADAAFLIARFERIARVNNRSYSRYSNSLQDMLTESGISTATLDVGRNNLPIYGETYFLDRERGTNSFFEKCTSLFRGTQPEEIDHWDELAHYLESRLPEIRLEKAAILKEARAVLRYQQIFERVLGRIQPKVAFLECYYHPTAMGYIRACRKLGIRTVEIQHGEQHGMYRGWERVPQNGYDTMPHLWWCWGKESADKINEWSSGIYPEHHAFVGGNPWITRFLGTHSPKDSRGDYTDVLIALPGKDFPVETIEKAIEQAPPQIRWHLRLHPMRRGTGSADAAAKRMLQAGGARIETEHSSSAELFELLPTMDFLITPWSTVAYEALPFRVHPVITHAEDRTRFESYVQKGLFSFADSPEELLAILKKDPASFPFHEETPYMETDRAKMQRLLGALVHSETIA